VTTRYPDGPANSPGFLLWHATLAWQRSITAVLRPLGLTHVQFVLLACTWWLDQKGDVPNQMTLARQAGTDVKMTSQVLRTLEAKGLLQRHVDPDDNRAKQLHITAVGAKLARRAIAEVERVDAEVFGAAASELTRVLQRLIEVMSFDGP
jgi:DNA-binding MarR family transcriptional regulator